MHRIIKEKTGELETLCRKHGVKTLELFGSANSDDYDVEKGDVDFLVAFHDMDYADHADAFFALKEDLESLFGRRVDLVETRAIRNPYFLASVNSNKATVYAG